MKLTKETLKRIIAEELEGVLEAYMGPMGPRGRGGYKPGAQPEMTGSDALAMVKSWDWNELEDDQKQRIEALAKIEAEVGRPELSNAVAKAKGSEVEEGMLGKVRDAIMGPETPEDKKDAKFRQQRMNTRKVQAEFID